MLHAACWGPGFGKAATFLPPQAMKGSPTGTPCRTGFPASSTTFPLARPPPQGLLAGAHQTADAAGNKGQEAQQAQLNVAAQEGGARIK